MNAKLLSLTSVAKPSAKPPGVSVNCSCVLSPSIFSFARPDLTFEALHTHIHHCPVTHLCRLISLLR